MFTQTFQMTCHPFEETIPVGQILQDERFILAMERLEYVLEHGLIALVSGPTGVGKTSLLNSFIDTLAPHRHHPVYLPVTSVGSSALLRMIVSALGEKPSLGKDRLFRQIHEKTNQADHTTLLIIDEAHLLAEATLTDLRLLLGARDEKAPPLKLLLCGQPPLAKLLSRSALEDLAGRISVRCRIHPLTKDQTVCYMDHRLKNASASDQLFEIEAKHLIHDHCAGLCRPINQLATTCLIHAASTKLKRITPSIVHEAAAEMGRY